MDKRKITFYNRILIVLAIIVVVNILSMDFFARLDLTDDNRYTLSEATLDIIEDLEQPVTVSAYFTEDLPPRLMQSRRNFKDFLIEYTNYSDGMIDYEFINPGKDEEIQQKAARDGVQPVIINVREEDQVKQQRAYLGAVIRQGEQKEVMPVITEEGSMEYSLSSNIKKLSAKEKPLVGFITGHGEPPMQQMQQVMESLQVLNQVETVNLDETEDLSKYKTLAWVGPSDSIPAAHFAQIDSYMQQGGNLFVAMNRVKGDFSQARGLAVNTGLESWLAEKGIEVGDNFVVDSRSGSIGVNQRRGGFNMTTQINFPYFPVISNFAEHPVTEGIEQVSMQFASDITFTGDTSIRFTPLATSSSKSGKMSPPLRFRLQQDWTESDFPDSNIPVAASFDGPLAGNQHGRMVLISDADFPVGGQGRNARQVSEDNVSLMVNSIDWLSDDTGLIALRTKGVSSRPIDELEDGTKAMLRYANFFVPILLIIIYGVIRFQRNRSLRVKRMEEGYV